MPSAASWSRRRAFSAFSIDRMVSPIAAPSYTQISGCTRGSGATESHRRAALRADSRSASAGSSPSGTSVGRNVRLGVDVRRSRNRGRHVLGTRVVPRDDRIEALVQLDVGMHCVQADRVAELPEPRDRGDTLARGQVVEDRLGHEQIRRRDSCSLSSSAIRSAASSERSMSCRRTGIPARGSRRRW